MKDRRRLSWMGVLTVMLIIWTGIAIAYNQDATEQATGNAGINMLYNPSFEGTFHAYVPPGGHPDCIYGICATAQIADGWTPWWVSHDNDDPGHIIRMPEYKPAAPWANRIHSGANAQQYFTLYSTHRAGFYQRVAVEHGRQYRFEIWGHAWESIYDDPDISDPIGYPINQQIGIDPTGGTKWDSPKVVWSSPHLQVDEFGLFQVCATAQGSYLTVFTFSEPKWAAKHNDVYWDNAELRLYQEPCKTEMSIATSNGVTFLTKEGEAVQPISVRVSAPVDPPVTWTASVDPGGTFTPTIESGSGTDGESFVIKADSVGKPTGQYSGTVTVTTDPPVIGSSSSITITLVVAPEIYNFFIPGVMRQ